MKVLSHYSTGSHVILGQGKGAQPVALLTRWGIIYGYFMNTVDSSTCPIPYLWAVKTAPQCHNNASIFLCCSALSPSPFECVSWVFINIRHLYTLHPGSVTPAVSSYSPFIPWGQFWKTQSSEGTLKGWRWERDLCCEFTMVSYHFCPVWGSLSLMISTNSGIGFGQNKTHCQSLFLFLCQTTGK